MYTPMGEMGFWALAAVAKSAAAPMIEMAFSYYPIATAKTDKAGRLFIKTLSALVRKKKFQFEKTLFREADFNRLELSPVLRVEVLEWNEVSLLCVNVIYDGV